MDRRLEHADVLTCIALAYCHSQFDRDGAGKFYVRKSRLTELSVADAPRRVVRLHSVLTFRNKPAWFQYRDRHHRFLFWVWVEPTPPSENEFNAKWLASRELLVDQKVNQGQRKSVARDP